jgi:hypothetical protein
MNRLFGQSKGTAVPKPTLNDTAATLDLRVETLNKQIATIDQGCHSMNLRSFLIYCFCCCCLSSSVELQAYAKLPPARKVNVVLH